MTSNIWHRLRILIARKNTGAYYILAL